MPRNCWRWARQGSGTPAKIGYAEAFQGLSEKIDAKQLRGHATKLRWIVMREHEHLSPEKNAFSGNWARNNLSPVIFGRKSCGTQTSMANPRCGWGISCFTTSIA